MTGPLIGHHSLARLLTGWSSGSGTLTTRLADGLTNLVIDGRLPAGIRLPSERELASALGISRNTVGAAFDELRATGTLISRTGVGTFVTRAGQRADARGDERLADFAMPPLEGSSIVDLRSAALSGLPIVAKAHASIEDERLASLLQTHGYVPGGLRSLRESIAEYYADLGLPTSSDQILITSGAQQALRLVAAAILEPNARVLIEDPTFRGALDVFRNSGALLVPALPRLTSFDRSAISAEVSRRRPALIFVQSMVHNPIGISMPADYKQFIANLSDEFDIPVLDDAALLDTYIDHEKPPSRPLAAYGGNAITVGSASKSFWGGLRIGWLRAGAHFITRLAALKSAEDLGTSLIPQLVTEQLLTRITEARKLRSAELQVTRHGCLTAVNKYLPGWEVITPEGGSSLWVRFPSGSASTFVEQLSRRGVYLFAGPVFSADNRHDDYLRIAFAQPPAQVVAGVRAMGNMWNEDCEIGAIRG